MSEKFSSIAYPFQPFFCSPLIAGVADCILANPICPGADGSTEETDEELKEAVHGALFTLPWAPHGEPRYDEFLDKMVNYLGLSSRSEVNAYAVTAYEAVYSYAHAVQSFTGDIRSDKVEFMDYLKNSSCPGILSNVTYDASGDRISTVAFQNFDYGLNEDSMGLWLTTHKYSDTDGISAVGSYQVRMGDN